MRWPPPTRARPSPDSGVLNLGEGRARRDDAIKGKHPVGDTMQFDTKIAIVIRSDLEVWQKLNVAAFLASGIAAAFPACIGEPYEDGSGTPYHRLIGQPIARDRRPWSRAPTTLEAKKALVAAAGRLLARAIGSVLISRR